MYRSDNGMKMLHTPATISFTGQRWLLLRSESKDTVNSAKIFHESGSALWEAVFDSEMTHSAEGSYARYFKG